MAKQDKRTEKGTEQKPVISMVNEKRQVDNDETDRLVRGLREELDVDRESAAAEIKS